MVGARSCNWLISKERGECGQGQNRTADTRIFSPLLYRLSYLARSLKYCVKARGSQDYWLGFLLHYRSGFDEIDYLTFEMDAIQ